MGTKPVSVQVARNAVIALLGGVFLGGCSTNGFAPKTCAEAGDQCVRFTVLHTNDHHGRFWENQYGEYGMAARKTLIDGIRKEVTAAGGQVLLFSGGDINTGVPESDLQDAKPDFIGMNAIGYDAMAVGNHEFDNPLAVLDKQRDWANFPMLAANIYRRDAQGELRRYFEPYHVFKLGDLRIAVVGLTTEDTARIGNPEYVKELSFTNPTAEMRSFATQIYAEGIADIVFGITHMGHYQDANFGSNAPGDVTMARELKPGLVQAIIGGHSQNPVCMEPDSNQYAKFSPGDDCLPDRQNGTWIMQAHEWGKYVGRADFEYYAGQLHLTNYALLPVNLKQKLPSGERVLITEEIKPDSQLKSQLEPYQRKGEASLSQTISHTQIRWQGDREVVRGQQTNLGHLIALAQSSGSIRADIGIVNSGGIRASIEPGKISYRDVLTVQPFGNQVTITHMTGVELSEYLSKVATQSAGSGGYAQILGVEMDVYCRAGKVKIHKVNGKSFDENHRYSFTLPGYNAAGGNGYPVLKQAINTGFVDADLLYNFLKQTPEPETRLSFAGSSIKYLETSNPNGCEIH